MKQLLLLMLLSNFFVSTYAQSTKQFSYLIVQMQSKRDDIGESYYRIIPEERNPNAAQINALVKYNSAKKAQGAASIYSSRSDTAHALFNYFTSISGALEFLDAQGWRLLTVVNNVSGYSGSTNTDTFYYLRKEVN